MKSKISANLGALLALSIIMCSCQKELDSERTFVSDDQISFRIEIDDMSDDSDDGSTQTKGTPIEPDQTMPSLGVYGFVDGNIYLEDRKAESDANVWTLSPTAYWPTDQTVDFIAYSPFADQAENGLTVLSASESAMQIEYTVPQDVTAQPDLMVSAPKSGARGDQVQLEFVHALATIAFKVRGGLGVSIKSITISNVASKGVLSYDGTNMSWQNESPSTMEFSAGITEGVMPGYYASDLTLTDGYLMMLPQTLGAEAQVYIEMSDEKYSTTVNFEFGAEWLAGECYTYVINTGSLTDPLPDIPTNGDYTSVASSNCYILTPSSEDKVFYIPIQDRINTFWGNNGYEYNRSYMIRGSTHRDIETQILWTDALSIDGFTAEIVSSGYENSSDRVAMKVTLPENADHGNIVVAVVNEGVVLWSWHFWITDYFPYNCYPSEKADDWFTPENGVGDVSKFGGSMWDEGGAYQTKYVMDRNVGAIGNEYISDFGAGTLFYQFGRKDPFPGNGARFVSYTDDYGTTQDGNSFISDEYLSDSDMTISSSVNQPMLYCISSDWSENSGSQYAYDENNPNVWNDPLVKYSTSASETKSIFDPSPFGWKIPNYNAWVDLDNVSETIYNFIWNDNYKGRFYKPNSTENNIAGPNNYVSFFPASGYMQTVSGSTYNSGYYGVYWSSTPNEGSTGRTMLIGNSTVSLYYNYCGYAFSVRSVME